MHSILKFLLIALLLVGCSSTNFLDTEGLTKTQIIEEMGLPDRTIQIEGNEIWEYEDGNSFMSSTGFIFTVEDVYRLTFEGENLVSWVERENQ